MKSPSSTARKGKCVEKTISSQPIYDGQVIRVRVDTVQTQDGRQSRREIVEHDACVVMVAIDDTGNTLLVRQYRTPAARELLEIPAGAIDPGETPDEAVRREMQEETGYLPGKIEYLGGFYLAPGYSTEYQYVYLVSDLVPSRLVAEDTGGIELIRTPIKQIPGLITSGKIDDAKSIAGLYLFLEHQKTT